MWSWIETIVFKPKEEIFSLGNVVPIILNVMAAIRILLKCLLLFAAPSPIFPLSPEQRQEIKNVIETKFMKRDFIPGVGLSVFYKDDVFATGYGLKDVEQDWKVDNQTLFAIASITKSFTATLVVKILHETFPNAGDGALDIPIRKLIPSFNFTMSDRYRSETTSFRDLMTHKTCLDTLYLGRTFGSISDEAEFTYRTRFIKEICPFRTGFTYNNGMFTIAGEAIAALANASYIDLLKDLLQQLGMNDTIIYHPLLNFDELPHASRGYYRKNGQMLRVNSNLFKRMHITLPSGALMPSSRDMAKYMQFHLNNGSINGRQIVPVVAMRRLLKPATLLDFSGVEGDYAYALGLVLGIHKKWPVVSHQGIWPPFTSRISLFPTLNLGIYTAINGPGQDKPVKHRYVHDRVFEIVTGATDLNSTGRKSNLAKPLDNLDCPVKSHQGIWPSFSNWLSHYFPTWSQDFFPAINGPHQERVKRESVHSQVLEVITDEDENDAVRSDDLGVVRRRLKHYGSLDSPRWKYSNVDIDPKGLEGLYGNPVQGEFTIKFNANDSTQPLYLSFGIWGTGFMKKVVNSNSTFYPIWDSDIVGDFLSQSSQLPITSIDFGTPNVALMTFDGTPVRFERNGILRTFATRSWSESGRCSPE